MYLIICPTFVQVKITVQLNFLSQIFSQNITHANFFLIIFFPCLFSRLYMNFYYKYKININLYI